jgi:hypothetical protein
MRNQSPPLSGSLFFASIKTLVWISAAFPGVDCLKDFRAVPWFMPVGEKLFFPMKGGDARTVNILSITRQLSVAIGLFELPPEGGKGVEIAKLFGMNVFLEMDISNPKKGGGGWQLSTITLMAIARRDDDE